MTRAMDTSATKPNTPQSSQVLSAIWIKRLVVSLTCLAQMLPLKRTWPGTPDILAVLNFLLAKIC